MGAWGMGAFENDDSMDWVFDLSESSGGEVLAAALSGVMDKEYCEAPECSIALAAAEVIAALQGRPTDGLPQEVDAWVDMNHGAQQGLTHLAVAAVQKIHSGSELKELWDESDNSAEWESAVSDLHARLTSVQD